MILFSIIISLFIFFVFLKLKKFDKYTIVLYLGFIFLAFFAVLSSSFFEGFVLYNIKNFLANLSTVYFKVLHSIIIATLEECIKFLLFLFLIWIFVLRDIKNKSTDFIHDSNSNNLKKTIVQNYAFVFALFFASFENIIYFIQTDANVFQRFFTASILHIGLACFYDKIIFDKKRFFPVLILLHATYNFSTYNRILFFTLGFAVIFICAKKIVSFLVSDSLNYF